MSPISDDFLFDYVNKFTGLGSRNFSMYTDPDRSHIGCNVSSLLEEVSLVVLFRQHNEGEEGFLIYLCHFGSKKVHKPHCSFDVIKCRSGLLHQVEPLK
jgi:hypothetical protein